MRATVVPAGCRPLLVAWRRAVRSLAHQLRLLRTDGGDFHREVAAAVRLPSWSDVPKATR